MLKVAVIGGGSTYTPELIAGFLERTSAFPLAELWLMDTDAARLEIVGGFARRMVAARGTPFAVRLTGDRQEAVAGAAYVVTQFRIGQMPARRADEYLGQRHGLIGQETVGVGGMAMALRTIPVILDLAEDIRRSAPEALLVNFTNPSGLVTQALARYAPGIASVGVCNIAVTAKMDLLTLLEGKDGEPLDPDRAELDTLGLNHLSWHRGLTLDGADVWLRVFEAYLGRLRSQPEPDWDPRLVETLGMIPNYYLHYFYSTARKLAVQNAWPPSRAEEVMELERRLLREYADPALKEAPAILMKRGGAYYSTMATRLLQAHYNDSGETHVVNAAHAGAVPGWPEDWVLEMPCRVTRAGIRPLPAKPLPAVCAGLLGEVKAYEMLAVDAAVQGDRTAACQALLAHPLGPSAEDIPAVLDDMLETNRQYLPRFWKD